MSDDDEVRRFRSDPDMPRWAVWIALVIVVGGVVLGQYLTSPWPRRGPGGGYGTNLWGPIVTLGATAGAALGFLLGVRAWYRRRR